MKHNLIAALKKIVSSESKDIKIKPTKVITFPEIRQSTNYSCGVSCVQGILYYYGIDIREDKLIKIFGAKPTTDIHSGVDPDILVSTITQRWGLRVDMRPMDIDTVKDYIDKNIPVILAIQAWRKEDKAVEGTDYLDSYQDGHYIVAVGYNDTYIVFEEPSLLSNRGYLSYEELENRWHDMDFNGNKYEHLGIAIYGKPPKYDPNVYKHIL